MTRVECFNRDINGILQAKQISLKNVLENIQMLQILKWNQNMNSTPLLTII